MMPRCNPPNPLESPVSFFVALHEPSSGHSTASFEDSWPEARRLFMEELRARKLPVPKSVRAGTSVPVSDGVRLVLDRAS